MSPQCPLTCIQFPVREHIRPSAWDFVRGRQFRINPVHYLTLCVCGHRVPTHVHHLVRANLAVQHQGMVGQLRVAHRHKQFLGCDQVGLDLVYKETGIHLYGAVLFAPRFREQIIRILADRLVPVQHLHYREVLRFGHRPLEHRHRFRQVEFVVAWHQTQELRKQT